MLEIHCSCTCFLVYINDLLDNLTSTVELFANDMTIFSIVKKLFSERAYKWKISFSFDKNKQAQELLFQASVSSASI